MFENNTNLAVVEADSGSAADVDIYDIISTSGGLTLFTQDLPTDIVIQNCSFLSNVGNVNPPNSTRPVLLKASGHGGAILVRLVGSQGSRVEVNGCTFANNSAEVDGGAVYISLSENASGNLVLFSDTNFTGNTVQSASGGAVSINSFNFTHNNTMLLEGCRFSSNSADSGGAVSLALYNSNLDSTQDPDSLMFRGCSFAGNRAQNEGTAVGLFSLVHVDQVGFPVEFRDW